MNDLSFNKLLLFCLLLSIIGACKKENIRPEIIEWSGMVNVVDTFVIQENERLVIAPGTEVFFAPEATIIANGDLYIVGKPDSIIQLTVENPVGNHRLLDVKGSSRNFTLAYAELNNGLITSFQTINHFHHVTFNNNQELVWNDAVARFWNGQLLIEDCTVNWNNQGEGFLLHGVNAPIIRNCTFLKVPDAVEYIDCINGEISGCRFEGMNDDAIDQNHCSKTLIKDNEFYTVKDRALELGSEGFGSSDSLMVINNLFVNCTVAINVKEASSAIIENATFYNNPTSLEVLNAADDGSLSQATIRKSIFVGGDSQVTAGPNTSTVISQCISDQMVLEGEANIKTFVEFLDVQQFDFTVVSSEFPEGMSAASMGYRRPQ